MSKTLFIGQGVSPQCWYRCALPAIHMEDAEWAGIKYKDDVTAQQFGTMMGGSLEDYPLIDDYETIIVQQVRGEAWRKWIDFWQRRGKTVIYECDDFVHGIYKIDDHRFKDKFGKKARKNFELCISQCDGMIASTHFLADEYSKYNDNQQVCLVSLDTKRYNVEFPSKNMTVIGWAGGTGHHKAVGPWLGVVNAVMQRNPSLAFASLGTNYAEALEPYHPGRTISIPWVTIENYPSALTNFDVMIAPSHDSKYFRSKSDLRWLEASAVGLPTIADPITYGDCEHLILAENLKEFEEELEDLVYDFSGAYELGQRAQEYVREDRDIVEGVQQWENAIANVKSKT